MITIIVVGGELTDVCTRVLTLLGVFLAEWFMRARLHPGQSTGLCILTIGFILHVLQMREKKERGGGRERGRSKGSEE